MRNSFSLVGLSQYSPSASFRPALISLNSRSQNTSFLSLFHRKTATFLDQKMLQPILVNALRINQQTLIKYVAQ